ncbi:MAG: hypothetical protein ACF8CQ_20030, partial [Rhodopirellula sp. JB044]
MISKSFLIAPITGLLIAGLPIATNTLIAAEIYVSTSGDDRAAGTSDAPLETLDAARRVIASRHLAGKEPVTVWVNGGTYSLDEPLRFRESDSGTRAAPITYRAVPGKPVTLKGSLPLDPNAWTPWRDGIYQQSLQGTKLAGRNINQLFMSNRRMVRSRFPNWDYNNPLRTGKGYLNATNQPSMEYLTFESPELKQRAANWQNPQTGILHAFHYKNWGNWQFRVEKMDLAKSTIHLGEGGWQAQRRLGVGKRRGHAGSPFYIENIFEELDAPFEWFHDTNNDVLYFKPPKGVDLSKVTVEAAVLSRIIDVKAAEHL